MKRLYRSKENRILFGIMGGLSDYLNQDVVILRILFIFLLIFTGFFPFGLFYFACLFVIPEEIINQNKSQPESSFKKDESVEYKEEIMEIKADDIKI